MVGSYGTHWEEWVVLFIALVFSVRSVCVCMYLCVRMYVSKPAPIPVTTPALSVATPHSANLSHSQQHRTSQPSYNFRTDYFLPQACRLSFVYFQQRMGTCETYNETAEMNVQGYMG
jgi:hypothetical protein